MTTELKDKNKMRDKICDEWKGVVRNLILTTGRKYCWDGGAVTSGQRFMHFAGAPKKKIQLDTEISKHFITVVKRRKLNVK